VAFGEFGEHGDDSQQHGAAFRMETLADDVHPPTSVEDGSALGR
jgi:hypothetical protein